MLVLIWMDGWYKGDSNEAIIDTSSISRASSGGRMEGSRAASIDLPAPGEPSSTSDLLNEKKLSHCDALCGWGA